MSAVETVTAVAASCSALAASYAAWRAGVASKATVRLVALDRERRDEERRRTLRADFTWSIDRRRVPQEFVVFTNTGQALARRVQLGDRPDWLIDTCDNMFPVDVQPGTSFDLLMVRTYGDDGRARIEVRWEDGDPLHLAPQTKVLDIRT